MEFQWGTTHGFEAMKEEESEESEAPENDP